MGNPKAYITPDVIADFTSINLEQAGKDRVRVFNVRGEAPTPLYKVSMAYEDGFKAVGSIIISGPNARAKAEKFADIFWARCEGNFEEKMTEYVGWNACHRSLVQNDDGNEILLRLGVRAMAEKDIRLFGKLVPSLILSGPPGVAVLGGVPRAQKVVSYWPALMPKEVCIPKIALLEGKNVVEEKEVNTTATGNFEASEEGALLADKASTKIESVIAEQSTEWVPLSKLCLARSGDKGDSANIGVLARSEDIYKFLDSYLTAQRIKDYFQELCFGKVSRFSLPNMSGFNFLLDASLGGGGTKTLRIDAQGKTFAQALLRQRVPAPKELLADL